MPDKSEKVTVDVPVEVTGEAAAGTMVNTESQTVTIEAEATHVPETIEVSIEGAEAGTQIHAGELTLPAGVTLVTDPEALVLHVLAAPTAEQLEAELGEVPAAEEAEEVPPAPEEAAGAPGAPEGQAQESAEQSG